MIAVGDDGCTPPAGTALRTFHWLRHHPTGDLACASWGEGDRWWHLGGCDLGRNCVSPIDFNLAAAGWRYWCPATPPDPT